MPLPLVESRNMQLVITLPAFLLRPFHPRHASCRNLPTSFESASHFLCPSLPKRRNEFLKSSSLSCPIHVWRHIRTPFAIFIDWYAAPEGGAGSARLIHKGSQIFGLSASSMHDPDRAFQSPDLLANTDGIGKRILLSGCCGIIFHLNSGLMVSKLGRNISQKAMDSFQNEA